MPGSYRLGRVPLVLCSLAPLSGSDLLLHSGSSASPVIGFLATEILVSDTNPFKYLYKHMVVYESTILASSLSSPLSCW